MIEQNYHRMLLHEINRRLIEEGGSRIEKCLSLLSEEDVWKRPSAHSNSVGNLILHLCGNVTQWLHSTMGGSPDLRMRNLEFEHTVRHSRQELLTKVKEVLATSETILSNITPDQLTKKYHVQGFNESGIAILIHITEHFSYHVGQITYFVKAHKDLDTGYYANVDLNITSP